MEIRPNFGGGSPGFIRGGVSFFLQGGVPDFPKQGRLYPSDPPRCTPMFNTHAATQLHLCLTSVKVLTKIEDKIH